MIESKFGPVTFLRPRSARTARGPALVFLIDRRPRPADFRVFLPGRRLAGPAGCIGCMLDRLILLDSRKCPETGRIIRPRRAKAGQLWVARHPHRRTG